MIESIQRRSFIEQTWDLVLDSWPPWDPHFGAAVLRLPLPPCRSVGPITYLDPSGSMKTVSGGDYVVALGHAFLPARIYPRLGKSWPELATAPGAVTVRFVAGYGRPENVPETIRQAILMLAVHWYEHGTTGHPNGASILELPLAVESLLTAEAWGPRV